MKMLRSVALLGLTVLLLAACVGLPPLMPAPGAATIEAPTAAPVELTPTTAATTDTRGPAETASATQTASAQQTATAPETGTPTDEATPTEEQVLGPNPLAGTVWEWEALIRTNPQSQSVIPNPANYALIFGEDARVLVLADCNQGSGVYTLENDTLRIEDVATTKVACPAGSLDTDFVNYLSQVESYLIEDEDLVLRIAGTGESLLFRNGGPVDEAAESPAAAGGAATPEAQPTGPTTPTPTASAVVTPTVVVTESVAGAGEPTLIGPVWQWVEFVSSAGAAANVRVQTPERYTVQFNEDGSVAMLADCNRAGGTYTVDGANMSIAVGPVTLAACGPGTLSDRFLIDLTSAGTFGFQDGALRIELLADAGTMVFRAAE